MRSARSRRTRWTGPLVCLFLIGPMLAQELGPATDYEWELQTPGRTLFRDRTLIGSVPLEPGPSQKGKRKKSKVPAGEALNLYIDMAFVPGDTVRYFGANLVLQGEEEPLAFVILDPDELAPLHDALRYLVKTAENIRNSQRTDTQILFRGRSDWRVTFRQQGIQQ
ncbi:MAG: hypothetical protein FJY66_00325, partial [Calditrichaeota bacterium]|nr:hypothetical protein [Calditrichota bacterium]